MQIQTLEKIESCSCIREALEMAVATVSFGDGYEIAPLLIMKT